MRRWRRILLHHHIFEPISRYMQRRDRRNGLKTFDATSDYLRDVIKYNLSVGEPKLTRTMRARPLYELADAKPSDYLLIIGPRDVHELLIAWCCGFTWDRILGVDLYSYNPKILVRDAEQTLLSGGLYDVIISSATVSYFHDPEVGLDEMVRLLKPGGRLIFSATYTTPSRWASNAIEDWRELLTKRGMLVYHYEARMKGTVTLSTYGAIKH